MRKFFLDKDLMIAVGLIFLPVSIILTSNKDIISIESLNQLIIIPIFFSLILIILHFLLSSIKIKILKFLNLLIFGNIIVNILNNNNFLTLEKVIILNIFLIAVYFLLKKYINQSNKFLNFFNLFLYILLVFSSLQFIYSQQLKKSFPTKKIFMHNNFNQVELKKKPNIIHIIPDGLMNVNYFNKDVRKSINEISEILNIDIFENSIANYPVTFLSLPSILNGSLINEKISFKENQFNDFIFESRFHKVLKKEGYDIFWYRTRWVGSDCNRKKYICMNQKFYNNELAKNYLKIINFNYHWIDKIIFKSSGKFPSQHLDRITNNLDEIYSYKNPKYIFAYLNVPHSPYTVNKNCDSMLFLGKDHKSNFSRKNYSDQTKCLIKQIKKLTDKLKKDKKDFMIIIQSDTGWSFTNKPSIKNPDVRWPEKQFKNFIAVSRKYNCINKERKISNADFLPMILGCISTNRLDLKNNRQYDAYYSKHPRHGFLYLRD